MARKQVITVKQLDNGQLQFAVAGAGEFTFNPDKASPANRIRAELHGWTQRISDKAALGADATPEAKLASMQACAAWYEAGGDEWNMTRAAGAGRKSEADWIIEATAAIQGVDATTMRERIERMAEKREVTVAAYIKALGSRPDVAQRVAEMKHGASAVEIDLSELGGE